MAASPYLKSDTAQQRSGADGKSGNQGKITFCAIFFLAFLAFSNFTLHQNLFDYYDQVQHTQHRSALQKELGLSLIPGVVPGALQSDRLRKVRSGIVGMFNASPKNQVGRISSQVMRYIAYRYFQRKYAWHIKGFEPHLPNSTTLAHAHILQTQLPQYSETVLEGTLASTGFSLEDAAMLISSVEQLVFDEIVGTTEQAYRVNGIPVTQPLSENSVLSVINSYLVENMMEGNFSNVALHHRNKAQIRKLYPPWGTTQIFISEIIGANSKNKRLSGNGNPGHAKQMRQAYSFEETARLITQISQEFGGWVNHDCQNMKNSLSSMDPHHTGRVKLTEFYKEGEKGDYHFLESLEYLRAQGVLDESDPSLGAQVLTANYVLADSNCLLNTPQFSVCCINRCEGVLSELESQLQSTEASPEEIWAAISNVTTLKPHIPFESNAKLYRKLYDIAKESERGTIPLQGRLFAQWLHFAFPRECVYPVPPGSVNSKTLWSWVEAVGSSDITKEQMMQLMNSSAAHVPPSPNAGSNMWIIKEELLPSSTASDEWAGIFANYVMGMMLFTATMIIVLRSAGHIRSVVSGKLKAAGPPVQM